MSNDDDEKNSELIARLLMQDQMQDAGFDDNPYLFGEEDQDDDFVPIGVIQKAKRRANQSEPKEKETKRKTREPKKKREKREKKEGENEGRWTEEEEKLFLEGLELFGRDWQKLTDHIKSRDKANVRSHAQKHFVRLWINKTPLPAKVMESGEGYTLSGKPLDPNSATVKMYTGQKYREKKEAAAQQQKQQEPEQQQQQQQQQQPQEGEKRKDPEEALSPNKRKKKKPFREQDLNLDIKAELNIQVDQSGRTSYAKSKLREQSSINHSQITGNTDPFTMVKCQHFTGEGNNSQPFRVEINSNVMLVTDFHSHLAVVEIIGFLAGSWDEENKLISVTEAFPCKSLSTGSDMTSVEMDPESEIEVRDIIKNKGLRIVGWYHSHPVFQPDPSIRDIENQTNYQSLLRENTHEPFIGLIVGPYDIRMPTEESIINCFCVKTSNEVMGQPMYVNHSVTHNPIDSIVEETLNKLIEYYKLYESRVNWEDVWRYCAPMTEEKKVVLEPLTKLAKLKKALKFRLAKLSPQEADEFIQKWTEKLEKEWVKPI